MPTLEIINQVVEDLAAIHERLEAWNTIYTSPAIIWPADARQYEVQVIDNGSEYFDFEGGVRNEDFSIMLAIYTRTLIDHAGKHWRTLRDTTESLFLFANVLRDALEGSFLTRHLLTRPFRITSAFPVATNSEFPGILLKRMSFRGGISVTR